MANIKCQMAGLALRYNTFYWLFAVSCFLFAPGSQTVSLIFHSKENSGAVETSLRNAPLAKGLIARFAKDAARKERSGTGILAGLITWSFLSDFTTAALSTGGLKMRTIFPLAGSGKASSLIERFKAGPKNDI